MTPGDPGPTRGNGWYGPPTGDPLAARLFPRLPGRVLWGLDRMQRIMAAMGGPHRRYPTLIVGGTNGKGTVAHLWARVLEASGLRTGLYTSPHLVRFSERIQVNGIPVEDAFLEEVAEELRQHIIERRPSFFEASTALALTTFARAEVDVAVLEVGLGGRLDAVNVVEPILTAITNVGLEHQELLGKDRAAIAREKAGIMRPGVPAYTAAVYPEALEVLAEEAASLGIPLTRVGRAPGRSTLAGERPGTELTVRTRTWGDLELYTPLLGAHQRTNVALAVRALEGLPPRYVPPRRAVIEGVANTRVPGRLQVEREGDRLFLLDVAHNPDGVDALVASLAELEPAPPIVGLIGILADKAIDEILGALTPILDRVILTTTPGAPPSRLWDPREVAAALNDPKIEVEADPAVALDRARSLTEGGGTILVTGSFYTVGGVLGALERGAVG